MLGVDVNVRVAVSLDISTEIEVATGMIEPLYREYSWYCRGAFPHGLFGKTCPLIEKATLPNLG